MLAPTVEVTYVSPAPAIGLDHADCSGIQYGFEGGCLIESSEELHLFTTEMVGRPFWKNTRLAYWRSSDGHNWRRISTLVNSDEDFTGQSPRASVWSPMVTYDADENRWALTYVCYRSKPNQNDEWFRDYDGRIAIAYSTLPGRHGIGGPYSGEDFILEPGPDSSPWEGHMGVDSFYPFRSSAGWLAWYGSSVEVNGLAEARKLAGPWKRVHSDNPVTHSTENPIVFDMGNGARFCLFDGCRDYQTFLFSWSGDGAEWAEPRPIHITTEDKWWGLLRTPLSCVQIGAELYRVYFSAYNVNMYDLPGECFADDDAVYDGMFASIGYIDLSIRWG